MLLAGMYADGHIDGRRRHIQAMSDYSIIRERAVALHGGEVCALDERGAQDPSWCTALFADGARRRDFAPSGGRKPAPGVRFRVSRVRQ
jgi:hypothetical protein